MSLQPVARYQAEWLTALVRRDEMVREAAATKTRLPADYWHEEYAAREKYRVAREIADAVNLLG